MRLDQAINQMNTDKVRLTTLYRDSTYTLSIARKKSEQRYYKIHRKHQHFIVNPEPITPEGKSKHWLLSLEQDTQKLLTFEGFAETLEDIQNQMKPFNQEQLWIFTNSDWMLLSA